MGKEERGRTEVWIRRILPVVGEKRRVAGVRRPSMIARVEQRTVGGSGEGEESEEERETMGVSRWGAIGESDFG